MYTVYAKGRRTFASLECAKEFANAYFRKTGNVVAIEQSAIPLNRLATDQKTVAERQWQQRKVAPVAQKQCDHGLFSDDAKQTDLINLIGGK